LLLLLVLLRLMHLQLTTLLLLLLFGLLSPSLSCQHKLSLVKVLIAPCCCCLVQVRVCGSSDRT
jgi:hypothetical protein